MTLVHFQGEPNSITVIQVYAPSTNAKEAEYAPSTNAKEAEYAPSTNAKEAEYDWFHEALLHHLELTPQRKMFFSS